MMIRLTNLLSLAGAVSAFTFRGQTTSGRTMQMTLTEGDILSTMRKVSGRSPMTPTILDRYLHLSQHDKVQAEYVWIDAVGKTRSKSRTLDKSKVDGVALTELPPLMPKWTFDGSSTDQAPGEDSEVMIQPAAVYRDPFRPGGDNFLVLCDTYTPHGEPLPTNSRYSAHKVFADKKAAEAVPWFGLEQEYTLFNLDAVTPLGWPVGGEPPPQGPYYCGAGADRAFGRAVPEAHYRACLYAGIPISGVNAEVMPGQWEYQVGPCVGIRGGDDVWMSRYLLDRVCEDFNVLASIHPKPITKGDWNGAGMHINFSTKKMREGSAGREGMGEILKAINKLGAKHQEHIALYGEDNELRLTGKFETASIESFSYGVANRGCSVRIPRETEEKGYGYLEDRRPASNVDPYVATSKIMDTVMEDVEAPPAVRKDREAA